MISIIICVTLRKSMNNYSRSKLSSGFRQSGQGRELGRFSIDEFTELKSVLMHIGPSGDGWVGA
jgi:betaine-aldehyde dehydrogenase